MSATRDWPDDRVLVPDLVEAAPQVRPVLDRYGLRGCGGPLGPHETLGFFARAHDVPLDRLLAELREGVGQAPAPPAEDPAATEGLADTIYRPFFKAGIAVVLTLGAVWGAYLLLRIAVVGSFTAAGLHDVNAHGHAQIFGWVGLFVMGFAYQAFPRFKHTSLAHPRLAMASLWLLLTGLVVRSVLEPVASGVAWLAVPAVAGSALEVVAIGLCVAIVFRTWRASGKPLAVYDGYVAAALVWFFLQAVYEAVYLAATLAAVTPEQLVPLVATWQAPLRDMQIHGFALLVILGVSQRLLPHFYGLPAPGRRVSIAGLVCLNAAVVGEMAGLILMRRAGHAWAGLWYGSVLLLAATVVVLVWRWRVFAAAPEPDRSLKFLRAAYVWLLLSLAMLVLLPAYQFGLLPWLAPGAGAARLGFSHAFYGATRHAITVGFVSLMIVGVAAKVVPTLNGMDPRRLPSLWLPFLFINTGCALRVVTQTLTDFTPAAFPVSGVSGVLEVLGLAVWAAHLWPMLRGTAAGPSAGLPLPVHQPLTRDVPIGPDHLVGDVLDLYPELLSTFVAAGFHALNIPRLRNAVARRVTVARACRLVGVDRARLLADLNTERTHLAARRTPLPVVDAG